MKHILLSCLLLLALCATARMLHLMPDVCRYYTQCRTGRNGCLKTPEQLAADYEQKLHAARVAQNGNYYGLKGMAGDLPLEVCLWTFDGMHGVASIVGRTGHPALQGIVDSLEFYK